MLHRGAVTEVSLVTEGARTFVRKRLLDHMTSSAEARDDFEREALILRALEGRGAPRLLAARAGASEPHPTLDLELGPRETVAAMPTSEARAHFASLARAAWAALAAVHDASDARGPLAIVHGDVSGTNVLVAIDRSCCLLVDFQLASYRDGHPPHDGAFRGTVATSAPEVAHGGLPTQAGDVFSMAITLLAAHAGEALRPEGLSLAAQLVMAAEQPLVDSPRVTEALRALPAHTADVVKRCLSHDPSQRPAARDVLAQWA